MAAALSQTSLKALWTTGRKGDLCAKEQLKALSIALVEAVRKNASIDWTIRESVKSKMRVAVKRLLKKYGYPPDMALLAIDRVLDQAEFLAEDIQS